MSEEKALLARQKLCIIMSWICGISGFAPLTPARRPQGRAGRAHPGEVCSLSQSTIRWVRVDCYARHNRPSVPRRRQLSARCGRRVASKPDWRHQRRIGYQAFELFDGKEGPLRNGLPKILLNAVSTDRDTDRDTASLEGCIPELDPPSEKQVFLFLSLSVSLLSIFLKAFDSIL